MTMNDTFSALRCTAVAACMLALGGAAQAQQPLKTWRHGIIEAKSDAGILFMMDKGGFAEKQGLKLEMVQVKADTTGLKSLLAGELDSYEGGPQGALTAAARGADVKIIGCHWLTVPHGIFARDTIHSLQDLKGKAVAVSSPGTMPEMLARSALEKEGIPVDTVQFASLGGDLDRYKALLAGVVQAAVISGEYEPLAAKEGIKLLMPGREALPKFLRVCLQSSGKVLSQRPDDAAHFLAAEMQALRYVMSHRDETVKLTQEITGAKPDDPRAAYIYDLAVKTQAIDPELPIPMDRLEWLQDQLVKTGGLNKPGDLNKMVDTAARARALELVGK